MSLHLYTLSSFRPNQCLLFLLILILVMRFQRRSKKYQCYSLCLDLIESQTHDLPNVVWHVARYNIHKLIKAIPQVRYTTCKPAYTIYLLQCSHCGIQYIGELEQPFHKDEFDDNNGVIEGQTSQCTKEKGEKDKPRSTKHYAENWRSSNKNLTKNRKWTHVLRKGMNGVIMTDNLQHSHYLRSTGHSSGDVNKLQIIATGINHDACRTGLMMRWWAAKGFR